MAIDDQCIDNVCAALSVERVGHQKDVGHVALMMRTMPNVRLIVAGSIFIFDVLHDSHLCVNCGCVYYVKREST